MRSHGCPCGGMPAVGEHDSDPLDAKRGMSLVDVACDDEEQKQRVDHCYLLDHVPPSKMASLFECSLPFAESSTGNQRQNARRGHAAGSSFRVHLLYRLGHPSCTRTASPHIIALTPPLASLFASLQARYMTTFQLANGPSVSPLSSSSSDFL